MTTCTEKLDRLNNQSQQISLALSNVQCEIDHFEEHLSSLKNERDKIQSDQKEIYSELNSLKEMINSCVPQSKTESENTENHHEPSLIVNNKIAQRSDTPVTVKSNPSWASMCESESDDDASLSSNEEDDLESIREKSEEVLANDELSLLPMQECSINDICNAVLFKITDKGGLFHLKTLDGQDVKHTDRSSGHLDVFRFKSGKFLENYTNVVKGMEIPVRLDANFPNNNLIWGVLNEYKAKVIRFEEKIAGNICVPWVPVLELTSMLGEKLEGTFTFGLHDHSPWYPNRKQPSLNETYLVSLSKNSNDEANRVFYKGAFV